MLKLYYADINTVPSEPEGLKLSSYRLRKLEAMKPELSRKQGIAAELLLNYAVSLNYPGISLPLNIIREGFGKPFCPELPGYFSLSHSKNLAVCAISDFEVGADIQIKSAFKEKLLKRSFAKAEAEYILNASDRDYAFTEIWAKKESCAKALGFGINMDFKSFSVVPDDRILIGNKLLNIRSGRISDYCLSVCSLGNISEAPEITEVKF